MKPGKVEKYIYQKAEEDKGMLFFLIDPDDQPPQQAAKLASEACEAGADIILVGGSIGAQGPVLDETCKAIKASCGVPVVLFPGNTSTLTPYADAVYFMSMFNSRNPYWVSGAQMMAAPVVRQMKIETIPTAYLVVEPGGAVGWVADAKLLPRAKPYIAAASAMAAEMMGSRLVVTDSGSGAPEPAPKAFIKAVASSITVPYIYGGGVRTPEQAGEVIAAGAVGVQIGTAFEGKKSIKDDVEKYVKAIKAAGKAKA
jgi:phosphoglycerol geranylgeranyltransferase